MYLGLLVLIRDNRRLYYFLKDMTLTSIAGVMMDDGEIDVSISLVGGSCICFVLVYDLIISVMHPFGY